MKRIIIGAATAVLLLALSLLALAAASPIQNADATATAIIKRDDVTATARMATAQRNATRTAIAQPTATNTPGPTNTLAPPTATPIPGHYLFDDEFDGGAVNTSIWAYGQNSDGLGNHQASWNPDACTVSGGMLHITAQYINGVLSSCALWTQGKEAIPAYGLWEARMRIPSQSGTWPAFWSVAYDALTDRSLEVWEIDVMEALDHNVANHQTISWNLHVRNAGGGDDDFAYYSLGGEVYAPNWHVYAVDWRPDHIAWLVDGAEMFRVTEAQVIGGKTVHIPAMRQTLIVQMALGSYSGVLDTSQLPLTMDVDFIRVSA